MNNKVILVVLDGLNYQVAHDCMGYLNGLKESGQASLYKVQTELPSMSRPLYECLLTGQKPIDSGIINNSINRLSSSTSTFSLAREAGLCTAAAAYHWFSELYNRTPYDPVRDRFTSDVSMNIQHGCFYHQDQYPDEHLFLDAEYLRRKYDPDFLLVHPMNIDDAGHKFGLSSSQYRNAARRSDTYLSSLLSDWVYQGYQIMVTSDHGMNDDRSHGGTTAEEREVPLFVIGERFSHQPCEAKQTDICGLSCELLGLNDHEKSFNPDLLGFASK
ncbi:alkaline phosphatase family protein [Sansalvadorimonas sp. 2012CJ34-2]|uniref:Alkaline phosphatase family protein n=1 Tax=Parendozoicomonas callyspongiae TaxID=2942213 RepID=A0ABT0PCJ7_9GAMM|nr:alkaline phosphatase family protein [Sansalvadorimonas sp. 2012CJ34-2]MCL6268477.1 alkaline phosphatase family protein [Sansalvadorimonas sp. 2012CJ34-2]